MTDHASFERYHVLLFRRQPVTLPLVGQVGLPGAYPVFSIWPIEGISSDARVGRWRHFEGDVLRAHFGERWPKVLADELTPERQKFLRIDGEDVAGQRYRLPRAVAAAVASAEVAEPLTHDSEVVEQSVGVEVPEPPANEAGVADALGDAADVAQVVEAGRRRPTGRRPGLTPGTLVRHLREIEGIKNYDTILTILESSGEAWVLSWLEKYADGDRPFRCSSLRKANSNAQRAHDGSCPYCMHGLPQPWKTLVMAYKGQD